MPNYIRADTKLVSTNCKNCGKEVVKQHGFQVVFFCSKACRRSFRDSLGKEFVMMNKEE